MKKVNKVLGIALVLVVLIMSVSNVFAEKTKINVQSEVRLPSQGTGIDYNPDNVTNPGIKTKANSIMGTFVFLVQIACVTTMIFMGLRYMFTSAEGKANVKKDLVVWCVGAVLVFGATTLIGLVLNVVVGDRQYVEIKPNDGTDKESSEKHWAYDAWTTLENADIIPGSITNKLGEEEDITRGQFFELLYNLSVAQDKKLEISEDKKNVSYVGVENGDFKDAVDKLYGSGIIKGTHITEDGKVNLEQNSYITREDLATVIYRYLGEPSDSFSTTDCNAPDKEAVSSYAKSAVYYLYNAGVIKGDEEGNINPKGETKCEEAITILYRIYGE